MRDASPCPVCGLGTLRAHYEVFTHQAACPVVQAETLLERERRAKAEG